MNVQVLSSSMTPIEKGILLLEEKNILCKVSLNTEKTITCWCFQDECFPWYPRMTSTNKISFYLKNIQSLCQEGMYSFQLKQWRRSYLTQDGIVIHLIEDIPESGGSTLFHSPSLNHPLSLYLSCSLTSIIEINKVKIVFGLRDLLCQGK